MPDLGNKNANGTYETRPDYLNVVALPRIMPRSGWLTSMLVHAGGKGGGSGSETWGAIAVWGARAEVLASTGFAPWSTSRLWRGANLPNIPVEKGRGLLIGAVTRGGNALYSVVRGEGRTQATTADAYDEVPDLGNRLVIDDMTLAAYVVFRPNYQPSQPQWLNGAVYGATGDLNPYVKLTIPHGNGDGDVDRTSKVAFQVRRRDTGAVVYTKDFDAGKPANDRGWFEARLEGLPTGVPLEVCATHYDTFGVNSFWTEWRPFSINKGPRTPRVKLPSGKQDSLKGVYQGTYSHPDGVGLGRIILELYDETGRVRLGRLEATTWYDPPGDDAWTLDNSWHGGWAWARAYNVRAMVVDNQGFASEWSPMQPFRTNSPPQVPRLQSPIGNAVVPRAVLTAYTSDPDGDPVAGATFELTDEATGARLPGYPKPGKVDGNTVYLDATADLTLKKGYRWKVLAFDAVTGSAYSDEGRFRFDEVPEVGVVSPSPGGVVNLHPNPSAEYGEGLPVATGAAVRRVTDGDAAFGEASWEISKTEAGSTAVVGGVRVPVASPRVAFFVGLKEKDGDASGTSLALRCYGSGGGILGTVALQHGDAEPFRPARVWRHRGGVSAALPAGTVEVEPIVTLASAAVCALRVDAYLVREVAADYPLALYDQLASWFGYFDGSFEGNGDEEGVFFWEGEAGASPSVGRPVLTAPPGNVATTYASSVAKVDDRLVVERREAGAWRAHHNPGWRPAAERAGARTLVPVPSGVFRNEGAYRLRVEAKDANGLVGEGPWVYVETRFDGPSERQIVAAGADSARAELVLLHERTDLAPGEFVCFEVRVNAVDGSDGPHVYRVYDADAESFVYRYPKSGTLYDLWLRQVSNVAGEEVGGRWARSQASVDYFGFFFLKTAEGDDYHVRWIPRRGELPEIPGEAAGEFRRGRGRAKPTLFDGLGRNRKGSLTVSLAPDPEIGETDEERLEVLEEIDRGRPVLCLLTHKPTRKFFIGLEPDVTFKTEETLNYAVDLSFKEVHYEEGA